MDFFFFLSSFNNSKPEFFLDDWPLFARSMIHMPPVKSLHISVNCEGTECLKVYGSTGDIGESFQLDSFNLKISGLRIHSETL